jgi:hypothetical protein
LDNALKAKKPKLKILHMLSDNYGVFGYCTKFGVLVARSYIYGFVVSCHTRCLYSAMSFKVPLLMYIDKIDKFYAFSPREILEDSESFRNVRGDSEMINFSIRCGKRY